MANKRYSLIANCNGVKTIIKIREYDAIKKETLLVEKTTLPTIDLLTSEFIDNKSFNEYYGLPENTKISIVYQSNGKEKKIPCVFKDNTLIRYFADQSYTNDSEISIDDEYFLKFFKSFLLASNISSSRNHMMSDLGINVYIKNKIMEYLEATTSQTLILKKLKQELVKYKNLRGVILSINMFDVKNKSKLLSFEVPSIEREDLTIEEDYSLSRFIPDDSLDEPLFPPNSEEEKIYNNYLESLPIEYSCHEFVKKL